VSRTECRERRWECIRRHVSGIRQTRISVEFSIVPFRDGDGTIVGLGALMRDVTRQFEEMKALRASARPGTQHGP